MSKGFIYLFLSKFINLKFFIHRIYKMGCAPSSFELAGPEGLPIISQIVQ
jgi:hypothetical protein